MVKQTFLPSWSYPYRIWLNQTEVSLRPDECLPPMGNGKSYGDANFLGNRYVNDILTVKPVDASSEIRELIENLSRNG